MNKNKSTYKKGIAIFLITLFISVVVCDFVGAHIRKVYHFEIKTNFNYLKSGKEEQTYIVNIEQANFNFILDESSFVFKIAFTENYLFLEEFCFKEIVIKQNPLSFRGPPTC